MMPTTFTVTSAADDGSTGTLRWAIEQADSATSASTIDFNIGTVGSQQTIAPLSALPNITKPVLIDGWSQGGAGYTGAPLVAIDGTTAVANAAPDASVFGLEFVAGSDGSTARGLVVSDFSGLGNAGIVLISNDDLVQGCYAGLNAAGTAAAGDEFGIDIYQGSNNTIGGTATGSGNVVSGNLQMGVVVQGGGTGNLVEGNLIGTDPSGTAAIPNQVYGIDISEEGGTTVGGTTAAGEERHLRQYPGRDQCLRGQRLRGGDGDRG